jgi:hypothetical protein
MKSNHQLQSFAGRKRSIFFSSSDEDEPVNEAANQTSYSTPCARDSSMNLNMTVSINTTEQSSANDSIETIDLVSPNVSPQGLAQLSYTPKTLQLFNYQRISILPMFPTSNNQKQPEFLLANVPRQSLSHQHASLRRKGTFPSLFIIADHAHPANSFMAQHYEIFFQQLLIRFHVDLSILDYNYARMNHFLRLWRDARLRVLGHQRSSSISLQLSNDEYPQLMEFYLQIDVDLFYMKTCTFRQAQPRSSTEGLFCEDLPESRYSMTPCQSCSLCQSSHEITGRQQPAVQFHLCHRHRFVNGYESILNAPASCSTTNLIYVLTCPCGEYDYIGESSQTLGQRLARHRELGNTILHRFFIGFNHRRQISGQPPQQRNDEISSKARMRLYQHLTQCPTVIQMFLDCNPQYWRFVPMLDQEAYVHDEQRGNLQAHIQRPDPTIEHKLKYVPIPPTGYRFSKYQKLKQYEYFYMKLDENLPNMNLDLYDAKPICLLPPNTSEAFRQAVLSLFITHTESKLNTLGHIFDEMTQTAIHRYFWCQGLLRRPTSTSLMNASGRLQPRRSIQER